MKTNIVKVKYEDEYNPKTFIGKAYTYYTDVDLEIGDIVEAPTRYGVKIARVSMINIDENEIANIKSAMKIITRKLDKDKFLGNNTMEKVA